MTTVANATGTTPQAAAVLVAQTLTNVALGLPLNSSLDSNAVLMHPGPLSALVYVSSLGVLRNCMHTCPKQHAFTDTRIA